VVISEGQRNYGNSNIIYNGYVTLLKPILVTSKTFCKGNLEEQETFLIDIAKFVFVLSSRRNAIPHVSARPL